MHPHACLSGARVHRALTEFGFLSTSTNRDTAVAYSKGATSILLNMDQGMVDRGADIGWLSQYPHESEILFGPLTGLGVESTCVDGDVLVVNVRLSVNLSSQTIDQVSRLARLAACRFVRPCQRRNIILLRAARPVPSLCAGDCQDAAVTPRAD
jgi:hypothetical protein